MDGSSTDGPTTAEILRRSFELWDQMLRVNGDIIAACLDAGIRVEPSERLIGGGMCLQVSREVYEAFKNRKGDRARPTEISRPLDDASA